MSIRLRILSRRSAPDGLDVSMDLMLLRTFQRQVALQCKYMILAAREVNAALQQRDMDRLFYAIQNLLNAADRRPVRSAVTNSLSLLSHM